MDKYEQDLHDRACGEGMFADRESTEQETLEAIALGAEQEQLQGLETIDDVILASRAFKAGSDMLFAALRKAGCL